MSGAAPKPRVLVIDDDPLVAAVVRRTLSRGYAVVTALGGVEALELLAVDGDFDAIVCDLLMPGIDGVEVHARLVTTAPGLAARVVFLTGDTFTAHARALLATAGRPALPKPFDAEQLRSAVASAIDAAPRRSAA